MRTTDFSFLLLSFFLCFLNMLLLLWSMSFLRHDIFKSLNHISDKKFLNTNLFTYFNNFTYNFSFFSNFFPYACEFKFEILQTDFFKKIKILLRILCLLLKYHLYFPYPFKISFIIIT